MAAVTRKASILEDYLTQVASGVTSTLVVMGVLKLASRVRNMWHPPYFEFSGNARIRLAKYDGVGIGRTGKEIKKWIGFKAVPKGDEIANIQVKVGGRPWCSMTGSGSCDSYSFTTGRDFIYDEFSRLDKFRIHLLSISGRIHDSADLLKRALAKLW